MKSFFVKIIFMKKCLKQCVGIDCSQAELVVTSGKLGLDLSVHLNGSQSFLNKKKGFLTLLKWVDKVNDPTIRTTFVVEATGVYHELLVMFLVDNNREVSVVLPNRAKAFSKTLSCKTVTDNTASESLCIMGLQRKLTPWQKPDPILITLRSLCREKEQLLKQQVAINNQLHSEKISAFTVKESVQRMSRRLQFIANQIKEIQKQISDILKENEALKYRIDKICSIRGIGQITAIAVVAETLGFAMINSRKQLASYAGYDVIVKESGTSVKKPGRMSHKGNKHLRKAMYMPSITASVNNEALKQLYNRLLAKHGIKMKALAAVQRKLLLLVYTIWKSGMDFQENYEHNTHKNLEQSMKTALTELA